MTQLTNKAEIQAWLDEMNIFNYIINDDLTVDVNEQVYLVNKGLTQIPIQFGVVEKNFDISYNQLTSLKGSPHTVNGLFRCEHNQLTNLIGGPPEAFDFNVNHNQLTTLEGAPEVVACFFSCENNQLTNLNFLPKKIGHTLEISSNPLTSLKGIEKCELSIGLIAIKCLLKDFNEVPTNLLSVVILHNPITDYSNLFNFNFLTHLMIKDYSNEKEMININESLVSAQEIKDYLLKLKAYDEKKQLENNMPTSNLLPKKLKM